MPNLPLPAHLADDTALAAGIFLLRRVHHSKFDYRKGRVDSSWFDIDRSEGVDHGVSVVVLQSEADLAAAMGDRQEDGLLIIDARHLRGRGLIFARVPENGCPNHCEVFGNLTGSTGEKLRPHAIWLKLPDRYNYDDRIVLGNLGDYLPG